MSLAVTDIEGLGSVEYLLPPEFRQPVYGERYPIEELRLGDIVFGPQVRDKLNPMLHNIRESIARDDMMNNPFVAGMSRGDFLEYIDFANQLWGEEVDPDSYQQAADGKYYLVIAGHTRIMSAKMNEDERAKKAIEQGYEIDPGDAGILCKVLNAPTAETIIGLQLAENLHTGVAKEREAMAIVETYEYGLRTARWSSIREFVEMNDGRFSEKMLRDARYFANLPPEVRDQVFCGALPYSVGVEFAKATPKFREHCQWKYFSDKDYAELNEEERTLLDEMTLTWLGGEVAFMQRKKLNRTASKKRIEGYKNNWAGAIKESRLAASSNRAVQDSLLEMVSADEQAREYLKHLQRNYRQALSELSTLKVEAATNAIRCHIELAKKGGSDFSSDIAEQIIASERQLIWGVRQGLGRTALVTSI